jgi:hypothetical protein
LRGCYAAELAGWMIANHLVSPTTTDIWTRAAMYHSRTPRLNAIYRVKLIRHAERWGRWLIAHGVTTIMVATP